VASKPGALRKLTPVDTGTAEGTMPTLKGVLVLPLVLAIPLLLITAFANVL